MQDGTIYQTNKPLLAGMRDDTLPLPIDRSHPTKDVKRAERKQQRQNRKHGREMARR